MPDTNYKSYENERARVFSRVSLIPSNPQDFDDTMKVYKCTDCTFMLFEVVGGKEDCIDVGRESCGNTFIGHKLTSSGQYVFTIKGGSHYNSFHDIAIVKGGKDVDVEIGNWSTFNFDFATNNAFFRISRQDGKPVTYCYRLGCRPTFIESNVKHLWWRSIGLTAYWWAKYVWHVVLKRKDNMGK